MRNLYARLHVQPEATAEVVHAALETAYDSDEGFADEAAAILLDADRERQYRRVHAQFTAASQLQQRLGELARDENRWTRRLREFD